MAEFCDWSDLPVNGCAHCRGITDLDSAEVVQVRADEDEVMTRA